ncbi:MAG TPA: DUF4062 domain-containing protein, partial [Ktedonobacterales bacterium]
MPPELAHALAAVPSWMIAAAIALALGALLALIAARRVRAKPRPLPAPTAPIRTHPAPAPPLAAPAGVAPAHVSPPTASTPPAPAPAPPPPASAVESPPAPAAAVEPAPAPTPAPAVSPPLAGEGPGERSAFHGRRILTRRAFISSTAVDLSGSRHPYREKVADALLRLDLFPEGMEQFNAQGAGDGTEVSLAELLTCDLYIGVVAWRYGTVPAGQDLSITHQEYRKARELGRPCYIFLADPATEARAGADDLFPAALRDPAHSEELRAFRAELQREKVVDYFTTPEDLAGKLLAALARHLPPNAPRNVPPAVPGFVGRDTALRSLCDSLLRGRSVELAAALAGMAGVGKSSLAQEAVRALAAIPGAFPSGILAVNCAERTGLDGLGWIEDRLLDAWEVPVAPERLAQAADAEAAVEVREQALREALAPVDASQTPSPALVLLDNVELDLPVSRLLDLLAGLTIRALLTSRHVISSPRLEVRAVDVLDPSPAVALFAERYQQRQGRWDAARDAADAGALVRALGYLPLAIELEAARGAVGKLSVAALAREVQRPDVLDRLKDPLAANASVRYAFERSLALATPAQRLRFAALGLPDGPDWPRGVIECLLDGLAAAAQATTSAADDLDALVALSLVALAPGEDGPRVRLHALLRAFAREEWARQAPETREAGLAALMGCVADLVGAHDQDFATLAREEELIAGTLRQAAELGAAQRQVEATLNALHDYLYRGGHW